MEEAKQQIKSFQEKVQEITTEEEKAIKGGIMVIIEDVVM